MQATLTVFTLLVNEDWNITLYKYGKASSYEKAYGLIGFIVIVGNFLLL